MGKRKVITIILIVIILLAIVVYMTFKIMPEDGWDLEFKSTKLICTVYLPNGETVQCKNGGCRFGTCEVFDCDDGKRYLGQFVVECPTRQ